MSHKCRDRIVLYRCHYAAFDFAANLSCGKAGKNMLTKMAEMPGLENFIA
jgi:hypothetical protein